MDKISKIGSYRNGNYNVTIYGDGTKVRENDLDFFKADFPESFDYKVTNRCDRGCHACHEMSTPDGEHGDIMGPDFVDLLHPYTEIAIGGGNPLCHPDLMAFLEKCKRLKLIPSMTVNQMHFMQRYSEIEEMINKNLIYGLGVSLITPSEEFIEKVKRIPNAVIHVIAGINSLDSLEKLANKGLKILILGYKNFGRGKTLYSRVSKYIDEAIQTYKDALPQILNWFEVVSFDNLAISQLDPKRLMTKEEYDTFFMGEDGFATMYVDAVKKQFAKSSTSTERYPVLPDIKDMFEKIRA